MSIIQKISVALFIQVMKLRKKILCTHPCVSIGAFTYGIPKVYFHDSNKLIIGKYGSISSKVVIFLGGEHRTDFVSTFPFNQFFSTHRYLEGHPATRGDVTIGNDVWIGFGSLIVSGVTIGDGAVIGANSVVTKPVPPYAVVAGNPAKIIRYRFSNEIIERLLVIKWWNWNSEDINEGVPFLFNTDISAFFRYAENLQQSKQN
nr:CatB-related O-acetyltransferase [Pelotalea chapellei]